MFSIIGGDGKEYGPVPLEQVKRWLAEGRANHNTQARKAGEESWRRLGDFEEIVGSRMPPLLEQADTDKATETAKPEVVLSSRIMRLGAAMLDELFITLCALPGMVFIGPSGLLFLMRLAISGQKELQDSDTEMISSMSGGIGVLLLGIALCAIVQCWLLTKRGQTVGKRICGIRIVRMHDDGDPGFVQVVLLRSFLPMLIRALPIAGFVFWVVDVCFILRNDCRCLHDHIAGTKVVQL